MEGLRLAGNVVRDRGIGRVEDVSGGPVVALQPDDLGAGEDRLELEDVADVGPPPSIDALIVVAHHHEVAVRTRQQVQQPELGMVGVLVFVHQQEGESVRVPVQDVGTGLQQLHRLHQQIVEVEGVLARQSSLILGVHQRRGRRQTVGTVRVRFMKPLRTGKHVLCGTDYALHRSRIPPVRVDAGGLLGPLHLIQALLGIENRERGRTPDLARVDAQKTCAEGVKGAEPHPARLLPQIVADALPHLTRRLVGEGDGEDAMRRHAVLAHQVGDPAGECPGLSGPRAGEYQHRPLEVEHGGPLLGVQPLQVIHRIRPRTEVVC